jgi:cytochrome c2
MTRRIVTLPGLAKIVGRHKNQVRRYRLEPDFVDEHNREFWKEETAQKIKEKIADARAAFHGRGTKIKIRGLKRKKRIRKI